MDKHQAAVARVIARGSQPAAIEEAEGDFGPDGIFASLAAQDDTLNRKSGIPRAAGSTAPRGAQPPARPALEPQMHRYRELSKLPKATLAQMHVRAGGLMGLPTYLKWTKDELVNEIMYHEGLR